TARARGRQAAVQGHRSKGVRAAGRQGERLLGAPRGDHVHPSAPAEARRGSHEDRREGARVHSGAAGRRARHGTVTKVREWFVVSSRNREVLSCPNSPTSRSTSKHFPIG